MIGETIHPILASFYGLNRSFTKKIFIGLECRDGDKLKPIVRLMGSDFVGIVFTDETWKEFQTHFEKIMDFFNRKTDCDLKVGSSFVCGDVSISLTECYNELSIRITESGSSVGDEPAPKRFSRWILMQKVTFESLYGMAKCVDMRIDALQKTEKMLPPIMDQLCDEVHSILSAKFESQIQNVDAADIKSTIAEITPQLGVKILDKSNLKELDLPFTLSVEDIMFICYELLSLNTQYVVCHLNEKLAV